MTVTIIGKDRLLRKLKAFPPRAETLIRAAMVDSAEQTVSMMKSLAPVDSGDLQMSISWTWVTLQRGRLRSDRSSRHKEICGSQSMPAAVMLGIRGSWNLGPVHSPVAANLPAQQTLVSAHNRSFT